MIPVVAIVAGIASLVDVAMKAKKLKDEFDAGNIDEAALREEWISKMQPEIRKAMARWEAAG